jgi:glycosyltransferase involved in cell wall biosynthesis
MRILIAGASPWLGTGYGVTADAIARMLQTLGHDVAHATLGDGPPIWNGRRIYGTGSFARRPDTIDFIRVCARTADADLVITVTDVVQCAALGRHLDRAKWVPISNSHTRTPAWFYPSAVDGCAVAISPSAWGAESLRSVGVNAVHVPHTVDENIFSVQPSGDYLRDRYGMGGHITMMAAANYDATDRKAFAPQLRAWARFAADRPDAQLYMHCDLRGNDGLDLYRLIASLGIGGRVYAPSPAELRIDGFTAQDLARIYNSAHVLLNASRGEGFGIPIVEAQACGTPVIVTNATAMPELIEWGTAVETGTPEWVTDGAWRDSPDKDSIYSALCASYADWAGGWPEDRRVACSDRVRARFSEAVVVERYWRPLIESLAM